MTYFNISILIASIVLIIYAILAITSFYSMYNEDYQNKTTTSGYAGLSVIGFMLMSILLYCNIRNCGSEGGGGGVGGDDVQGYKQASSGHYSQFIPSSKTL